MSKADNAVKIKILDKEYLVSCPDDEREALEASVKHLSQKMSEIRSSGKVVGIDRIAVMAGLNLAHESIHVRHRRKQLECNRHPAARTEYPD